MSASRHSGSSVDERPRENADAETRLRALFDAHYQTVWRSLLRFGVPEAEVDDAAQEVFIVAARRIADIVEGKARAFLLGCAHRVASEARRARRRRPEDPSVDALYGVETTADTPEEALHRRRARRLLDEVLDDMNEAQRSVFVLFELEGMTMAEISEALELAPGTVASRLRRARESFETSAKRIQAVQAREQE